MATSRNDTDKLNEDEFLEFKRNAERKKMTLMDAVEVAFLNKRPTGYLGQFEIAKGNAMLYIPEEVVEMDDILTQQMISTYRHEIAPLRIKTPKP